MFRTSNWNTKLNWFNHTANVDHGSMSHVTWVHTPSCKKGRVESSLIGGSQSKWMKTCCWSAIYWHRRFLVAIRDEWPQNDHLWDIKQNFHLNIALFGGYIISGLPPLWRVVLTLINKVSFSAIEWTLISISSDCKTSRRLVQALIFQQWFTS